MLTARQERAVVLSDAVTGQGPSYFSQKIVPVQTRPTERLQSFGWGENAVPHTEGRGCTFCRFRPPTSSRFAVLRRTKSEVLAQDGQVQILLSAGAIAVQGF